MCLIKRIEELYNTIFRFDLGKIAFLIFLWSVLNLVNGVIAVNPNIISGVYDIINGTIRILIGLVSLIIFIYLWHSKDRIVIIERKIKG